MKPQRSKLLKALWYNLIPSFPVWTRLYGMPIAFDSRDTPQVWYIRRARMEDLHNAPKVLAPFNGMLWDIGASVGLYSCLWLKYGGGSAVAFEISPKAASYIRTNAQRNRLKNLTIVPWAISVRQTHYTVPTTASEGNRISHNGGQMEATLTWENAALRYGSPHVIKMDIEGDEREFLNDTAFQRYVGNKGIRFLVEIHTPEDPSLTYRGWNFKHIHDRTYQAT